MKSKEELIQIMAKVIYDGQEGLKGAWMPEVPGLCDVYLDKAEAALKALCGALPDVPCTHYSECAKDEAAKLYSRLKQWGK